MDHEMLEFNEKLEKIEAEALEDITEVTPLESNNEVIDATEDVTESNIEMSTCSCMGGCGSNYSYGSCTCSGNCGSNYHK